MGLFLFKRQAVQKPAEFPETYADYICVFARPVEFASLQAPVVQPEPVVLPLQYLDLVPLAVAEYEQTLAERVQVKSFFDQYR